jgi:hypothetical protein
MSYRSAPQRAASRRNGAASAGPRTEVGKVRASLNRVTHGLNSTRLLVPTEDVDEYRAHVDDWEESLSPTCSAEQQVVVLLADLAWRLRRLQRIEERRAVAILDARLEGTPEWKAKAMTEEAVAALDALQALVSETPVPVTTVRMSRLLVGVSSLVEMLDRLRELYPPESWPQEETMRFVSAKRDLSHVADREDFVVDAFVDLGKSAGEIAAAFRPRMPDLDARVSTARTHLATTCLLVDEEDKRFERHRRLLENAVARQLDLLAKLKAATEEVRASGSSERLPAVELRVIRG